MAKANFSKVEKALEDELMRMTSNKLLQEAPSGKKRAFEKLPAPQDQITILKNLELSLKRLSKKDPSAAEKGKIDLEAFKTFLDGAGKLTEEQWKLVKEMHNKVDNLKKTLLKNAPISDETLVEAERKKHINKRFNVHDKWLPLQ